MAERVSGPIGAVVVTHNRKELLRECLQAVLGQTRRPDAVLVVDNASTDGTRELLAREFAEVQVLALPENQGGAGGFHEGMKRGLELGFSWLWVMDDDTIPEPAALERLVTGAERLDDLPAPTLLASKVVWTDGRVHPLNWPGLRLGDMDLFLQASERGVLPLRWNTFPSSLLKREALERHGLPLKHFWIWSDDIEFTARLLRDELGYVVPESVVRHKTATAYPPWQGGDRFYYALRNGIYILRGNALRREEKTQQAFAVLGQTGRFLLLNRFRPRSLKIVLRGLRDGVCGAAA